MAKLSVPPKARHWLPCANLAAGPWPAPLCIARPACWDQPTLVRGSLGVSGCWLSLIQPSPAQSGWGLLEQLPDCAGSFLQVPQEEGGRKVSSQVLEVITSTELKGGVQSRWMGTGGNPRW